MIITNKDQSSIPSQRNPSGVNAVGIEIPDTKDVFLTEKSEAPTLIPKPIMDKPAVDIKEVSKPHEEKEWTVLFYIDGNNNLEPAATESLLNLENIGSNDKVNVVAQLGRLSQEKLKAVLEKSGKEYKPTNIDGDWCGSRRYYVEKDNPLNPNAAKEINSPVLMDIKEKDMSASQVLADFLVWAMKNFKSKNYFVVLMDHGGGWRGAFTDDATATHNIMKPNEIAEAFGLVKTALDKKPDIVHMAACLMASAETAYEMKDSAKYYVSSEELSTSASFNYSTIIKTIQDKIAEKGEIKPEDLAKFLVDYYKDKPEAFNTQSAVDLEKMQLLKDAFNNFAEALWTTDTKPQILKKAIENSQNFSRNYMFGTFADHRDLYDVAEKIEQSVDITDIKVKDAAKALRTAIETAVVAEVKSPYTRWETLDTGKSADGREEVTYYKSSKGDYDCHGLTIFAPTTDNYYKGELLRNYQQLALSKETKWDEFILKIANTKDEKKEEKVS